MSTYDIDYAYLQNYKDPKRVIELIDDDDSGQHDSAKLIEIIDTQTDYVERKISAWSSSDLAAIRIAKPLTVKMWIAYLVIYVLYTRAGDPPISAFNNYQRTLDELDAYAKTGEPPLIVLPGTTTSNITIAGNMTEEDLGERTENGEPLPWSWMQ